MQGRLHDALAEQFGRDRVFMDIHTMPAGVDFADQISMADRTLGCSARSDRARTMAHGHSSWRTPGDSTILQISCAFEIEAALQRDMLVIPILVQGAKMPLASELPSSLSATGRRNALELSDGRWSADVAKLVEALATLPGGRLTSEGSAQRHRHPAAKILGQRGDRRCAPGARSQDHHDRCAAASRSQQFPTSRSIPRRKQALTDR